MATKKKRKKYDVFMSYSLKDSHLVDVIERLLRVNGRKVFRDSSSIALGTQWKEEIESALANSKLLVVCWCCHSKRSKYVKWETSVALRNNMAVVPVILCNEEVSPRLRSWEWIDFRRCAIHLCQCQQKSEFVAQTIMTPRRLPRRRNVFFKTGDTMPSMGPSTFNQYLLVMVIDAKLTEMDKKTSAE